MSDLYNAESAVIGGLLLYPEECSYALDELSEKDFADPRAADAFKTVSEAVKSGEKMDAAIFGSANISEETKKYALLAAESFLSTSNYDGYVDTVKAESGRRRVTEGISELLVSGSGYEDLVLNLGKIVDSETSQRHDDEESYFADYIASYDHPVNIHDRILTGIPKLDQAFHGMIKGSLCYIGAFPSTGKTSLACNIANVNYEAGKRVQFISLEMSKEQILDRMISSGMKIDYGAIDMRKVSDEDAILIVSRVNDFATTKRMKIQDKVYTIEGIAQNISKYKPDVVFIDYIQNVRTTQRYGTKKEQIDYISAELKRIARVNNCLIICLSQLVKPSKTVDIKHYQPTMSDLKESGNLSNDGDYIMILYRPYVLDKKDFRPEETQILIDKNKFNGSCGFAELTFDGPHQKFYEVETRYDED